MKTHRVIVARKSGQIQLARCAAMPFQFHPHNRALLLRNRTCCYCGQPFEPHIAPTKEHVIARRFVPRGCLAQQWNLIMQACEGCNGEKAALEDDISAITMLPDASGMFAVDDPRLRAEAARKALRSRSRRTGKPVAESRETLTLNGRLGPALLAFNFAVPPQIAPNRLRMLAHYHFRGFFYWLTYNEATQIGGFPGGGFHGLDPVNRHDWGSPHQRWFMDVTREWEVLVHAIGADTFFKLIIRRSLDNPELYSAAIEWNHAYRICAFVGVSEDVGAVTADLPPLEFDVLHETTDEYTRVRLQVPLAPAEDDLFSAQLDIGEDDSGRAAAG